VYNLSFSIAEYHLSSCARGSLNKYVISDPVKLCRETDTERRLAGRVIHTNRTSNCEVTLKLKVYMEVKISMGIGMG